MRSAAEAVFGGDYLLAVGIKPTYPNTGYGYIKRGDKWIIVEEYPDKELATKGHEKWVKILKKNPNQNHSR